MGLREKLSKLFSSAGNDYNPSYWISVQCNRCGEKIRARIDLRNDLSINFGDRDENTTYFCRKVLMGEQHCFQKIEVELTFDGNHHIIEQHIQGGKFITENKPSG